MEAREIDNGNRAKMKDVGHQEIIKKDETAHFQPRE